MNEGTDLKGRSTTPVPQISLAELFQTLVAEFAHAKPVREILAKIAACPAEIFTGSFTISGTEGFASALALIVIKDILIKQAPDPVLMAIMETERDSEAVIHDLKVLTEYLDLACAPLRLAWYPMLSPKNKRDLTNTFDRTVHHYRRHTALLIKKELTKHAIDPNFKSNSKMPSSRNILSLIIASTEAAQSCDHLVGSSAAAAPPLRLTAGKKFDRNMLLTKLAEWGYIREHYANEPGEVAVRGDICEVFAPNSLTPVRIYFFGDEIEVIKQAPLRREHAKTEHAVMTDAPSSKWITLTECLLSPFITKPSTSSKTLLDLPAWARTYHKNVFVLNFKSFHRTDSKRHFHFPTLPAYQFNNQLDKVAPTLKRYTDESKANYIFTANPLLTKMLLQLLDTLPLREAKKEAKRSFEKELAKRPLVKSRQVQSATSSQQKKNWITIGEVSLSRGFMGGAVNVWTAEELFGKRMTRRAPQVTATASAPENFWETFLALEKDDYVVHLHHGIGIYRGIERLTVSDREKDYFKIEYQNQAKLFIPVEQIKLIQKYIGDRTQVRIDALGKNHWNKVKERARKVAERIAKKLFTLYSRRTALRVSPLPKEDYFQHLFEMRFPYEESRDQVRAIEEIKTDLEKDVPMDRLLCADVGYGKTEVALRAIFKVAMAGRQTLVLIPTTLLAMQHYETFSERFKTTPVRVAVLSRFTKAASEKIILKEVQTGKIDVLLSTHKGLSKKVKFHKLALLVIDEEQKFGVKQKEMMREIYPAVHVLSLSATPIPRTLHLSLSSFRSLSFITTPILGRRPVHTTVAPFDDQVVRDAFDYEYKRSGQCYFIYNYVQTLATFEAKLKKILPAAKILSIHAKLDKSLIEHRFQLFRSGAYNVLLSTNIVDAGLDLPRVNTILVYDAHRFGLAQLYQLKGRVGRSDRQAYAYLFYPQNTKMSVQAKQRLNCLVRYAQLGSGYQIAIKDLELRGAGNLLGLEQSGTVAMVGLEFFSNLLRDAVATLHHKQHTLPLYYEPVIELSYQAYIPDDYIRMPSSTERSLVEVTEGDNEASKRGERIHSLGDSEQLTEVTAIKGTLYRKIMTARSHSVLRTLQKTLSDEYGSIPKVMEGLFAVSAIKILAKRLRVLALIEKDEVLELRFLSTAKLCPLNIRNLLTSGYIQVRKESPALTDPLVRPPEEMISIQTPVEKTSQKIALNPTSQPQSPQLQSPKTEKTQIAETKVYFALSRFKEGDKPLRLAEKLYYARILLMMMTDESKPVDLAAFKQGKHATLEI
ncbi:transcription-repair-coupling factor [Spirochaetota bacterium]|nr:transcription-repair-coupling factor [Spirochaetota bacterium]